MKLSIKQISTSDAPTGAAKRSWSIWMAVLVAVAVYFLAQIIAYLVVSLYPEARHWSTSITRDWLNTSIIAQFAYVLLAEALTFGAIWWFVHRHGERLQSLGWRRVRWLDAGYALAGFALYFVLYAVVLAVVSHLVPGLNVDQKQQTGFQNAAGAMALTLTFISLVILPPLVEETVFRGFLYGSFRRRFTKVPAAIFVSLLFASAHLQFGSGQPLLWIAAIDTFVLSMVLCWLREETKGLWAGIFVHMIKNGLAFFVLFVAPLLRLHWPG